MSKKQLSDFTRPTALSRNQHARRLSGLKLPTLDPAKQAELEGTKRYRLSLSEQLMGFDTWARQEDGTQKDAARHHLHMQQPPKREKIGNDEYQQYLDGLAATTTKDPVKKRRLIAAQNEARKIGDQFVELTPDPERLAQADCIFTEVAWKTEYPASVWRATEKLVKASREADHEVFEREFAYVKNWMETQASKKFVDSMAAGQASAAERAKLREVFGAPVAPPEPTQGPQPRKVEPGEFDRWTEAGRPTEAPADGV